MQRRQFLFQGAFAIGGLSFLGAINKSFAHTMEEALNMAEKESVASLASNEDFWAYIRNCFTVSPNILNLNNGGVSPQPKIVQDTHIRYYQYCNEGPSYYMWRILDAGREALRAKLAALGGVSPDEIAINRNSTEGLNNIIFGLTLSPGDEIVLSKYDYPNMMNAWKQREKRDGIKINWIDIPQPFESDAQVVELYKKAITPKTKIVHITHCINWSGNFVPVRAIADYAHSKGCEVILDSAHSFAHTVWKIEDTGADYMATSLHKWLTAPFGSGMLYIKKDKISKIWPALSSAEPQSGDIRKFESLGTRSMASEMSIGAAIDFHHTIGSERKEARLRYLKDYWLNTMKKNPKLKLYTKHTAENSCAIATIGLEGWKAADIETTLLDKYKIHVVPIAYEGINGIRITPNVYTNTRDLDHLVNSLNLIASQNPPSNEKK